MKYLSLFSGIGGFELGIEQAYEERYLGSKSTNKKSKQTKSEIQLRGKRPSVEKEHSVLPTDNRRIRPVCIGYSENDKYAIQIYEKHFGKTFYYCGYCGKQTQTKGELFTQRESDNGEVGSCCVNSGIPAPILFNQGHKNYGDITTIKAEELPDFDLLVGGFPCQSFSIAGKRGGFSDTRGTLFFEIARIIREKQPRLLLLENVKGLLSHDKGNTFRTIISTLDELGYDIQWQVLNSKNFGVPQNRERVFIIGHLRGTSRPEVFPIGSDSEETDSIQQEEQSKGQRVQGEVSETGGDISSSESGRSGVRRLNQLNKPKHSNDRVYGTDGVSPTINTAQGGNRQPFVEMRGGLQAHAAKMINQSPSLTEAMGQGGGHTPIVNSIRRLTPTECERLQGFPDGWTEGVSDTQRYKTLGNAVTVNVIKEIMKRLI